jgi:hypothetical protein
MNTSDSFDSFTYGEYRGIIYFSMNFFHFRYKMICNGGEFIEFFSKFCRRIRMIKISFSFEERFLDISLTLE